VGSPWPPDCWTAETSPRDASRSGQSLDSYPRLRLAAPWTCFSPASGPVGSSHRVAVLPTRPASRSGGRPAPGPRLRVFADGVSTRTLDEQIDGLTIRCGGQSVLPRRLLDTIGLAFLARRRGGGRTARGANEPNDAAAAYRRRLISGAHRRVPRRRGRQRPRQSTDRPTATSGSNAWSLGKARRRQEPAVEPGQPIAGVALSSPSTSAG
jgi:hypothetical protein